MQIKLNQKLYHAPNRTFWVQNSHYNNMVFPQVIAAFHGLYNAIGLPGNLFNLYWLDAKALSVNKCSCRCNKVTPGFEPFTGKRNAINT